MTIVATHLAIVLGSWRLRVRIDIDEPREAELRDADAPTAARAAQPAAASPSREPGFAPWGRG